MKESDIVSTLTVRFVAEGDGAVVTASNAVSAAQEKLLARLNALASASESSATRQASSAAAVETLARKADPAVRALAELEQAQVKLSRALGQGVVSVQRANEILDVYAQKANAAVVASENLRRQQSNISTNTTVAAPSNPTQITGAQLSNVNTRDYAAQFEAAAAAHDAMVASAARLRAALDPLGTEEQKVAERLGVLKSALDATMITQDQFEAAVAIENQGLSALAEKLNVAAVAAENLRRQQANASVNQGQGFNPSSANTSTYAAQFEAAAAAQDAMVASMARLRAELNPFEAEQGRLGAQMATYKAALDAGKMSLAVYTAEQEKAGAALAVYAEKLNSAEVAAENLRRQQSNLSTNTTVAGPSNPTQITGAQLSNVNVREYAAQVEAAAKAHDDMTASVLRLRSAINPLEAEQGKLAAEMKQYKIALDAGAISQQEFTAAHAMAGKRLGDFAQSLKTVGTAGRVASGEMTNLGFQLNDVVTGLALGQSPFMIIAQQGGQLVQIFANSKNSIADFARSSMTWFTSLFTVGRVAFGGIAAAIGAVIYANASYISSQREVTQSLIGIGARTQTTASQINEFAKANASSTGLSVDQARMVGIEFTKTGNITVAGIKGVGEAIHGFSILTGQSAEESSKAFAKAFSGDIVSGAEELNKTYGFLNAATRDYIRSLELQGDRSGAMQVIIDAIAKDNLRAAESVSLWAKAYDALANAASKAKNAIGAGTAPQSSEDQLAALEKQKTALEAPSSQRLTDPAKLITGLFSGIIVPPGLEVVNKMMDALKEKIASIKSGNLVKELDAISLAGDNVVRSVIPEIAKIEELQARLQKLNAAQNEPGVTPGMTAGPQQEAARTAINNQLDALRDAQAQAARYNERVQEISKSWGDVGQSTALALQSAANQLPVMEAVGGAARMAAQQTADYKNAMDQGKSSTEAAAMAASNLAASMAQVNTAAKEQLFALQNSLPVAQAWTAASQMLAQQQATYNKLLHDNVKAETAAAVAAAEYADSKAKAVANAQKLVQSSEDNLEKIKAEGTGMEGVVASSIAYRDAIQAGASYTQAAAISANVLEANLLQAAAAADKVAQAAQEAQNAMITKLGGGDAAAFGPNGDNTAFGGPNQSKQYTSTSNLGKAILDSYAGSPDISQILTKALAGGIDSAIKTLSTTKPDLGGFAPGGYASFGLTPKVTQDDLTTALVSVYDIKKSQTTDPATLAAINKDELATLMGMPKTQSTLNAIKDLTQSVNSLAGSTDSLNRTNTELLSPYYTQDPRTSHIGFRSQGMASGGSFIVPGGYSSNDNMVGQIPLASGEQVSVTRPGESNVRPINIYQTINIQGSANRDEVGRTQYHAGQNLARQLRASSS